MVCFLGVSCVFDVCSGLFRLCSLIWTLRWRACPSTTVWALAPLLGKCRMARTKRFWIFWTRQTTSSATPTKTRTMAGVDGTTSPTLFSRVRAKQWPCAVGLNDQVNEEGNHGNPFMDIDYVRLRFKCDQKSKQSVPIRSCSA